VVPDIDSLPNSAVEPLAAFLRRWLSHRWRLPDWPGQAAAVPDARAWIDWIALDWIDLAWVVLWLLGLAGILIFGRWEAIPFHLTWISFALLYCFRVRTTGATLWVLAAMVATTSAVISADVVRGLQPADELTAAPLTAAMFWVMMWHGHRRQAANAESVRISAENEQLLSVQQRFLQDASHQLRTPITIALGHSELLARHLVDQQDKRDIDVVVGELNRLRLLSERLLLIAASADPQFLQPEAVELTEFVTNVVWRWRPTADRRWQLGRLDEATVPADRERLGLAVDALLENAVQHTRRGDAISLSVVHADESGEARLVVEDTGSGIGPAELGSVFERFTTGSHAEGRRGTGLGLALVRAVAEGHGGDVGASSAVGQGSRFELILPLYPVPMTTSVPHIDPCRSSR
jgi:signal transduction histidine kinase